MYGRRSVEFSLEEKLLGNQTKWVPYLSKLVWITSEFQRKRALGTYFWFVDLTKATHSQSKKKYMYTKKKEFSMHKVIKMVPKSFLHGRQTNINLFDSLLWLKIIFLVPIFLIQIFFGHVSNVFQMDLV